MASFDHWVRPLTGDERQWCRTYSDMSGQTDAILPVRCDYGQGQKRCSREALYLTTYDYVTGKAGRVSSCRRRMCLEHAARFARKHGCSCSKSAENFPAVAALNAVIEDGRV